MKVQVLQDSSMALKTLELNPHNVIIQEPKRNVVEDKTDMSV